MNQPVDLVVSKKHFFPCHRIPYGEERMTVMEIVVMTDHTDNDVMRCSTGN